MSADIKKGDWVVYDLKIGQVMAIRAEDYGEVVEFSDGFIRTSGVRLKEHLRPLTLRNKVIVQSVDHMYERLRKMDGNAGFNFPDISSYFSNLALDAIDGGQPEERAAYDKAQQFLRAAEDYQKVIDGVRLFRPHIGGS